MMLQAVQASSGQMQAKESSNSASKGLFGDILSKTLDSTSVEQESMDPSLQLNDEQIQKLTELLEFLNVENITDIEQGKQLVEDMMISTADLQNSPIIQQILEKLSSNTFENSESIEVIVASLIASLQVPIDQLENQDVLKQLETLVTKLSQLNDFSDLKNQMSNVESVLKFSKIYSLMKNHLDMTNEQLEKLDSLKQSLDKVIVKLEGLLTATSKGMTSFEMLLSRQNGLNAVQSAIARNISSTSGAKDTSHGVGSKMISSGEVSISTNPFMNMSKVEQFVLSLQNSNTKAAVNQEQLIKSFENILSRAQLSNVNGIQKLFIKLNPEHLGSLRIELIQREGIMMAKIIASSNVAKEMLDSQLHGLKQAFANQNIAVEKIDISQQFQNMSQERNLQREQGQQQQQHQDKQQSLVEDEQLEDFQNQFEQAILQAEV